MIESKYCNRIIAGIMAVAVFIVCVGLFCSDTIASAIDTKGVTMEYETKLFDHDTPIDIDIEISDEDWNDLLENPLSKEYYCCDVTVNGKTFKSVGLRTKGNTSLSNIADDDTTDRYSYKIEFDHYIEGQTCYGLDKLTLNNNYADATNMKEALVYDMFQYLGADASLYNYAKISVNGEYRGVYLALETVEDSFKLRNYGVSNGNLYKPDTMQAGGKKGDKDGEGHEPPEGMENMKDFAPANKQDGAEGFDPSNRPDEAEGFDPSNRPDETEGFDPANKSETSADSGSINKSEVTADSEPANKSESSEDFENASDENCDSGTDTKLPDATSSATKNSNDSMPQGAQAGNGDQGDMGGAGDMGGHGGAGGPDDKGGHGGGGMERDVNGADLNYTDVDLDSYSAIWDGEIDSTGKKDHKRVVEALKNISEGNDIEKYLNVDNMLKYMAVHTFAVNLDSLSGSMAHNYYLYEQDGQLNMIPWDYNLSWGGYMSGGSNSASSTINFAIDTPFSSEISLDDREIFAALLENEDYLEQYHYYLQKLCEEYIDGGVMESTYERIRSQIDDLVAADPTAFYSYEEYDEAATLLKQVLELRAESIEGQLDGTIPSTNEGQQADSSALIDASGINLTVLGRMNNGHGNMGGPGEMNKEQMDENQMDKDQMDKDQMNKDQMDKDQVNKDQMDKDQVNKDQMDKDQMNIDQVNDERADT